MFFFFQAEDGIRDVAVTGVQTCALPILTWARMAMIESPPCERFVATSSRELDTTTFGRNPAGRITSSYTNRSEEHTSELQSRLHLVCRLLLEKKKHNATPSRTLRCQSHS